MNRVAAGFALLTVLAGCDKKDEAPASAAAASSLPASAPAPSAPGASGASAAAAGDLAPSSVDPAATSWPFAVDPKGKAHVDMPGLKEHIIGDTSAAAGTLEVVPQDLAKSRGLVRVDLATFATHTFHNEDDASQTTHARTWLEVVVDGKTNERQRWAELAIRSIDGVSASNLASVAPVAQGGDDVRTVTATIHGDLRIHGHTVPKDAAVELAFHYPKGAPADAKPARLEVKSKQPVHVVLKEYDVHPRDPAGTALAWTTQLLGKVAETADVTVDLAAAPAG